jgi:hypothetical protein
MRRPRLSRPKQNLIRPLLNRFDTAGRPADARDAFGRAIEFIDQKRPRANDADAADLDAFRASIVQRAAALSQSIAHFSDAYPNRRIMFSGPMTSESENIVPDELPVLVNDESE